MLIINLQKGGDRVTNTEMLREAIKKSGLKLEFIAEKLGITRFSLAKKIENITEFKTSEVQKMCDVLQIEDVNTKEAIFFAKK